MPSLLEKAKQQQSKKEAPKPEVKNDLQELAKKAVVKPIEQPKVVPTETEKFFAEEPTTTTIKAEAPTILLAMEEPKKEENSFIMEAELPKIPTKQEVKDKQEILTPTTSIDQYPITIPDVNSPFLQMVEVKEKDRILTEINLLKFAIKSALKPNDYYEKTVRRSGAHKLQTIFNISTTIINETVWKEENQWIAKYRVKAIAPNGRSTEAIGICEQNEKGRKRTRHDTEATAQTRATSRAILDLVGFGAVSKEEIDD